MQEVVASEVLQAAVGGVFSFVFSSSGEKASQEELMERLEMAHIKLHLGLERTRMMPITIWPLFWLRKKLKDVTKECGDLLVKAKDRKQVLPSLCRKIMHSLVPSFIVPNQDVLSSSAVGRFERFVKEADRFVKEVESGCSLSHPRFINPLIRHLLEGKDLSYHTMRGSQTCSLGILTAFVEEYGIIAVLDFRYEDCKVPLKSFELRLVLRVYESTNIVGVTVKCLRSLGLKLKSLVEVAAGELSQLPTQDVSYHDSVSRGEVVEWTTYWSQDPYCCIENGLNKPCANSTISSTLAGRFPEEVIFFGFKFDFSAYEYCSQSSTDEARISTIKSWPPLKMLASFAPHYLVTLPDGSSRHLKGNTVQKGAIDFFIRSPDKMDYGKYWEPEHGHGWETIKVSKKRITKLRKGKKEKTLEVQTWEKRKSFA